MFARFDASKSTKGASKLRRDLINAEIANLRDLLPLPPSTRQRLSQLQLMALVCVYVRKANYFQQAFKRHDINLNQTPTPNIGFSKALSGFLMMMTQNGKLLYISDNAAEYLGHSMEDLLIHGDSVYDIIDKQDHEIIQLELGRITHHEPLDDPTTTLNDCRMFLCRMNVSRNSRRQLRFGDQKVVLVRGHYLSFLPLCSRNEPVFLATCTPIAMPETRECVVLGATNVFTSIHSMDMKFMHIDKNGEFHLEYTKNEIQGISWYKLLHWEYIREAQTKHKLITQNEQDRSCILLVKLQRRTGDWLWVHCVLQVKENMENNQQPVIVCTNQVLSDHEAAVMHTNGWLYHNYMVHNKLQYGLSGYDAHTSSRVIAYYHNTNNPPPPMHSNTRAQNQYNTSSTNTNSTTIQHHHHQQYQSTYNTIYPLPQYGSPPSNHQQPHQSKSVFSHQQKTLNSPRTDVEPVDYSVHTNLNQRHDEGDYIYNNNNNNKRNKPVKYNTNTMTTVLDFEPLKINQSRTSPSGAEVIMDLDQLSAEGNGILIKPNNCLSMSSIRLQKTFVNNRSRIMLKTNSVVDPAEFIEQWNPSPPWSDTLQKVPTSPPSTPTSTPTVHYSSQTTFTFDLIQDGNHSNHLHDTPSSFNSYRYLPTNQHQQPIRSPSQDYIGQSRSPTATNDTSIDQPSEQSPKSV